MLCLESTLSEGDACMAYPAGSLVTACMKCQALLDPSRPCSGGLRDCLTGVCVVYDRVRTSDSGVPNRLGGQDYLS